MKDEQPLPCCDENKTKKVIVYKDFNKKPKGFYLLYKTIEKIKSTGFSWQRHSYEQINYKKTLANFCPFCGKDISKLNLFL